MACRSAFALIVALTACGGPVKLDDSGGTTSFGFQVLQDCQASPGTICPFIGTGNSGFNGDGHPLLETWLSQPMSITFSPYGQPVVADWNNHKLRMVDGDSLITIMGTSFIGDGDFDLLDQSDGAPGTTVSLNHPTQQRYFPDGRLLSASWHTHKLRTWDPISGLVRVLIGGAYGFMPPESDPPGQPQSAVGALLNQPRWIEFDPEGDVWIVDMRNERIRELDLTTFEIATVAGSGAKGVAGEGDCTSEAALETCFAFPNNTNPVPGGAIQFNADATKLFIADSEAHVVRILDVAARTVSVLAGSPGVAGADDGPAALARFRFPSSLAFDAASDTLFVADTDNHRVRAIDLATMSVSTFAGNGQPTCEGDGVQVCDDQARGGDGGPATEATLYHPFGVDLDLEGNVVIADTFNNRFRIVYR